MSSTKSCPDLISAQTSPRSCHGCQSGAAWDSSEELPNIPEELLHSTRTSPRKLLCNSSTTVLKQLLGHVPDQLLTDTSSSSSPKLSSFLEFNLLAVATTTNTDQTSIHKPATLRASPKQSRAATTSKTNLHHQLLEGHDSSTSFNLAAKDIRSCC